MMQTPPNIMKGSGSGKYKNPPFKYKYEDISCKYCLYRKKCKTKKCSFIMENLDDLFCDINFINAINDVVNCSSAHRETLISLNKIFDKYIINSGRRDDC